MTKIKVNIESINDTMRNILNQRDELEIELNKSRSLIDESKSYYDTPSGTYFREKVDEYSEKGKKFLENDLRNSIEILSQIVNLYQEEIEEESKIINSMIEVL